MSNKAIQIENISKRYRLIDPANSIEAPKNIWDYLMLPYRRFKEISSLTNFSEDDTERLFWALKDISFSVEKGEVVGIIGKNGAGKSTLLKILSRITSPTEGRIVLNGRVSSLLEVGTGFNNELTGRENIYMNGTIHGMSKSEIDRKFDEIVAFAGVENFIDIPVKRYSSGMRVRLGFAVAAHLEPEILIVDEVLAVGDVEFQKKCVGKMNDVTQEGRTVLFVSHDMATISSLCDRTILLDGGRIRVDTDTETAIHTYLEDSNKVSNENLEAVSERNGNQKVTLTAFRILDAETDAKMETVLSGQDIIFEVDYQSNTYDEIRDFNLGLAVFTDLGQFMTVFNSKMADMKFRNIKSSGSVRCSVPNFPLMKGNYVLKITLHVNGYLADQLEDAVNLTVESGDFYGSGFNNDWGRQGVYSKQHWF